MSLSNILLVVIILMLIGAVPTWPHSRSWGYGPSSIIAFVFAVLLALVLLDKL